MKTTPILFVGWLLLPCLLVGGATAEERAATAGVNQPRFISAEKAYDQILEQLSTGRQDMAEILLVDACKQYQTNQRLLFAIATCARSRGKQSVSMQLMDMVVELNPESAEGQCASCVLKLDLGTEVASAFEDLSSLLNRKAPESVKERASNGALKQGSSDVANLLKMLSSLADANPTNPFILWILGIECRQYYRDTDKITYSEKGAESYRKLLNIWVVGPAHVHRTYGSIMSEELGRSEEALKHYQLAVQLEPACSTYEGLGITLGKLRRYEEANAAFKKCIEFDSKNAAHWANWALSLYEEKEYGVAIEKCQKAIELDPDEKCALSIWGHSLVKSGRPTEAADKYRRAAEDGYDEAQYCLGKLYDDGKGVQQDYGEAVKWYQKSADQGYAMGQCELGYKYYRGEGVPQDYEEAVKWYQKSADQGHANAQNNLGAAYYHGQGVRQDLSEAMNWLLKAAEGGHIDAQYQVGCMYSEGVARPTDFKEAVKWFQKSADQGYPFAQCTLGWLYNEGKGVPQDYGEAARWYRKSADRGFATAQTNLGWLYEVGEGVAEDRVQAHMWYSLAAAQGFERAKESLLALELKMTKEQIAEAEKLAREFKRQ